MNKEKFLPSARVVALVGLLAATIECGKLALSFLPNVEVVTLLVALYGYVFGWYGVVAAAVFVCIEPLIYGFGPWVVTYFIYWPLVGYVFYNLGRQKTKHRLILSGVAVALTLLFGILSSLIDCAVYIGVNEYYFTNLFLYYLRGIPFYVVQIVCNAVLFPTLFPYLARKIRVVNRMWLDVG